MSTEMRTLLNPLLVLYRELADSKEGSRALRQARQAEGRAAAEMKARDSNAMMELGRELAGTTAEALFEDLIPGTAEMLPPPKDSGDTSEDDPRARLQSQLQSAVACLASVGLPDGEDGRQLDGAARASAEAEKHLREERKELLECARRVEEARNDAQRA